MIPRRILCFCLCMGFVGLLLGADAYGQSKDAKVVTLVIDYGDGVEKRFTQLRPPGQATVLDIMNLAEKHKRGITFEYQGKGATALLTQIDKLKNEGRGNNWIYRVNGKLGDRSFGVFRVKAGDTILWKFGKYK